MAYERNDSAVVSTGHVSGRFLRFLLVGGVGFAVDAGVLTLFAEVWGYSLLVSRLVSFACATLVTWLMNRFLVFADRRLHEASPTYSDRGEYLRYMAVQVIGASTNFLVFYVFTMLLPQWSRHLVVPLAAGSICAAFVTFTLMNLWLYRAGTEPAAVVSAGQNT